MNGTIEYPKNRQEIMSLLESRDLRWVPYSECSHIRGVEADGTEPREQGCHLICDKECWPIKNDDAILFWIMLHDMVKRGEVLEETSDVMTRYKLAD